MDKKYQTRITLEAEAILGILTFCESGKVELLSSDVLIFETENNPNSTRKEYASGVLAIAKEFIQLNLEIEKRAQNFNEKGIKPLDALHLASAEEAKADYFCTCDDRFLKKVKQLKDVKVKVVSPLELIEELEK